MTDTAITVNASDFAIVVGEETLTSIGFVGDIYTHTCNGVKTVTMEMNSVIEIDIDEAIECIP